MTNIQSPSERGYQPLNTNSIQTVDSGAGSLCKHNVREVQVQVHQKKSFEGAKHIPSLRQTGPNAPHPSGIPRAPPSSTSGYQTESLPHFNTESLDIGELQNESHKSYQSSVRGNGASCEAYQLVASLPEIPETPNTSKSRSNVSKEQDQKSLAKYSNERPLNLDSVLCNDEPNGREMTEMQCLESPNESLGALKLPDGEDSVNNHSRHRRCERLEANNAAVGWDSTQKSFAKYSNKLSLNPDSKSNKEETTEMQCLESPNESLGAQKVPDGEDSVNNHSRGASLEASNAAGGQDSTLNNLDVGPENTCPEKHLDGAPENSCPEDFADDENEESHNTTPKHLLDPGIHVSLLCAVLQLFYKVYVAHLSTKCSR